MVIVKPFAAAALLLAHETLAIRVRYSIKYRGLQNQIQRRHVAGPVVDDTQANRIRQNIHGWSRGYFIATDLDGNLVVTNTYTAEDLSDTQRVVVAMRLTLQHHVFGAGANH